LPARTAQRTKQSAPRSSRASTPIASRLAQHRGVTADREAPVVPGHAGEREQPGEQLEVLCPFPGGPLQLRVAENVGVQLDPRDRTHRPHRAPRPSRSSSRADTASRPSPSCGAVCGRASGAGRRAG
jgi:hypothetical protein